MLRKRGGTAPDDQEDASNEAPVSDPDAPWVDNQLPPEDKTKSKGRGRAKCLGCLPPVAPGLARGFSLLSFLCGRDDDIPEDELDGAERHMQFLREECGGFVKRFKEAFKEDEDLVTEYYVETLRKMEDPLKSGQPKGGPYLMSNEQVLNQLARMGYNDEEEKYEYQAEHPVALPTQDMYAFVTWKWMRKRLFIEHAGTTQHSVVLFYLCIVQVLLSAGIWGIGASEMDGGRIEVVLSTFAVGVVGLISATYGLLGSLAMNESFIRKYFIGQLWVLSIVTVYLYTSISVIDHHIKECHPSGSDLSDGAAVVYNGTVQHINYGHCGSDQARALASFILATATLVLCVVAGNEAAQLQDGLNDTAVLEQDILIFKHFQRRYDEVHMQLAHHFPETSNEATFKATQKERAHLQEQLDALAPDLTDAASTVMPWEVLLDSEYGGSRLDTGGAEGKSETAAEDRGDDGY
eukprot:Sspe_Gene.21252::Locus_7939_Transcript_1_1_Confidence_1.000_Length_1527::g.21252::m.21252